VSSPSQSSSSDLGITPTLTLLGPAQVQVQQDAAYSPCTGGRSVGCDQGAVATLKTYGDLTAAIM
jgi:hypothetical protein